MTREQQWPAIDPAPEEYEGPTIAVRAIDRPPEPPYGRRKDSLERRAWLAWLEASMWVVYRQDDLLAWGVGALRDVEAQLGLPPFELSHAGWSEPGETIFWLRYLGLEPVCAYCKTNGATSVDHVHPRSKAGGHERANVVPACRSCNSSKRDREATPEWVETRRQLVRLRDGARRRGTARA